MSAKHSETGDAEATSVREESDAHILQPKPAFSEFEVCLLILRLLRDQPRTGHTLTGLLSELEKSENGGYEGRIVETLQQMVTGGYIRTIQHKGAGEAFALTSDGLELICTPP